MLNRLSMNSQHGIHKLYCFVLLNDLLKLLPWIFLGYLLLQRSIFYLDIVYKLEYLHATALLKVGKWFLPQLLVRMRLVQLLGKQSIDTIHSVIYISCYIIQELGSR